VTGIQGISSNVITFGATGTYIFEFTTVDAGTTVHVTELTRARNELQSFLKLPILSSAPTASNGMIAISDGSGWDPHSTGQQELSVYINGGWVKLS